MPPSPSPLSTVYLPMRRPVESPAVEAWWSIAIAGSGRQPIRLRARPMRTQAVWISGPFGVIIPGRDLIRARPSYGNVFFGRKPNAKSAPAEPARPDFGPAGDDQRRDGQENGGDPQLSRRLGHWPDFPFPSQAE